MRARHPDLFSDTRVHESLRLPKAVFEYHLDTLTSRKQEYEFEHFCRKLAEKEICPNLRVQTGPTGGGDSKVDTETYPVAAEIAERWWIGEPLAGAERWAFAFSAKKAWKPKVKADVANVLTAERDYKRIYFFTNQFVKDKDRSAREDALSKQAGVPVHIIDRAWIVEKVYENDHLEMAVAALGIEGAGSDSLRRPGPRDTARLAELEQLDKEIADPTRYQGAVPTDRRLPAQRDLGAGPGAAARRGGKPICTNGPACQGTGLQPTADADRLQSGVDCSLVA